MPKALLLAPTREVDEVPTMAAQWEFLVYGTIIYIYIYTHNIEIILYTRSFYYDFYDFYDSYCIISPEYRIYI